MSETRSIINKDKSINSSFTKRGRFEIIYDILSISRRSANKTRILYRANLSFSLLKKYLDLLMTQGMLIENDGTFSTTKKGKEFIGEFERLNYFFGTN